MAPQYLGNRLETEPFADNRSNPLVLPEYHSISGGLGLYVEFVDVWG